jgi:hypothetical protein
MENSTWNRMVMIFCNASWLFLGGDGSSGIDSQNSCEKFHFSAPVVCAAPVCVWAQRKGLLQLL